MLVLEQKLVCMSVVASSVLHGCKIWMLNAWERQGGKWDGNVMFEEYKKCKENK